MPTKPSVGVVTCIDCGDDKVRNPSTRKKSDGSTIFVDAHDRPWTGRRCPQCAATRRSRYYQNYKRRPAGGGPLRGYDAYCARVSVRGLTPISRAEWEVIQAKERGLPPGPA